MKICYLAQSILVPSGTGGGIHVMEVARHLSNLGIEVHVVSRVPVGFSSETCLDGVYLHRVEGVYHRSQERRFPDPSITVLAALKAIDLVRRYQIDILQERHAVVEGGAGVLVKLVTGRPLIIEMIAPHLEYNIFTLRRLRNPVLIAALRSWRDLQFSTADLIITPTASMVPKLGSKVREILNAGVDIEAFGSTLNRLSHEFFKDHGGAYMVVYVGGFYEWSGLESLVRCAQLVLRRFPNVKFILIGSGPEEGRVRSLVADLQLQRHFVFLGRVGHEEAVKHLCMADVAVAPYDDIVWSSFAPPIKIFEYMAAGRAVVSTKIGLIPKIVKDEQSGLLVNPSSSEDLAEAIIRLLEDPELRFNLGRKAREESMKYTWERVARSFLDIYEKILFKQNI